MLRALWTAAFLVIGVVCLAPSLRADNLSAGASGPPDTFALGYSSCPPGASGSCGPARTVLSSTLPSGTSWGTSTFGGYAYEQVEADPTNPFCSGCLDFLYQVSLNYNSNQGISSITETGFSGYQVDVGYDTLSLGSLTLCGIDDGGFCNSGNPNTVPVSVDRSADGNTIGFSFSNFPLNDSTVDLVIMTNATSYAEPISSIYGTNGGSGTIDIYGPSGPPATAPEPSAVLLVACGLFVLSGLRKKLTTQCGLGVR